MSDVSGNDVCRLRIEFENNEIDWEYPLALNGRIIKAMYVNDERIRECYACSKLAELRAQNSALRVRVYELHAGLETARDVNERQDLEYIENMECIAELKANNANLHELASMQADKIDELTAERDEYYHGYLTLMNRNAELCQLVRDMFECCEADSCDECSQDGTCRGTKDFYKRMKKLGIEVDS